MFFKYAFLLLFMPKNEDIFLKMQNLANGLVGSEKIWPPCLRSYPSEKAKGLRRHAEKEVKISQNGKNGMDLHFVGTFFFTLASLDSRTAPAPASRPPPSGWTTTPRSSCTGARLSPWPCGTPPDRQGSRMGEREREGDAELNQLTLLSYPQVG